MSGVSCKGCLTITWEIRNCSIMLAEDAEEECVLNSPIFKTETRVSKALWNLSMCNNNQQYFTFQLRDILKHQMLHHCEMSLISSEGEISLDLDQYDIFSIEKSKVLLKKQYILPEDTLTVCCRMRDQELTTEDFIIRSVLQEVNFNWDVKLDDTFTCQSNLFEESNMLFHTILEQLERLEDFTIRVEGLPSRCGWPSLVRCNILLRDGNDKYDIGYISDFDIDINYATRILYLELYPKYRKIENFKLDFELIIATHNELPMSLCVEKLRLASNPGSAKDSERSPSFPGTLSNDLLLLYREGTLGDVTLKTEDKSLSAHKNILSARSKVFRAMFESKHMKESNSGTVDIDDIGSATLDRMLVFLYGESLDDMSWEEASELYYAADKYEIDILKSKCGEMLSTGLTVSNACDALVLADTHADEELMRNALDFVRGHDEVIYSAEWEKLEDNNPRLAAKVTRDLYSFLKKGKK